MIKGISDWVNVNFTDSYYPLNADHFSFSFETKNPNDLLNFLFSVLNQKSQLTQFISAEKKLPLLNFRIQILK